MTFCLQDLPKTLDSKKSEPETTSKQLKRAAEKTLTLGTRGGYPDLLTEMQQAVQAVAHLQTRAEEVWHRCHQTTIPLSPAQRNAQEAEKVGACRISWVHR